MNQKFIVKAFCTEAAGSGNPAAVILNFQGDDLAKQQIAKQFMLPVTVFVTHSDTIKPILQFFYPEMEMNLCLHGALAAMHVIMTQNAVQSFTCSTAAGKLLQAIKTDDNVQIKLSSESTPKCLINSELIAELLNLKNTGAIDLDLPLQTASVGSPKLLVPLKSSETLAGLNPNFDLIKAWSLENKVNGLYVYAQDQRQSGYFYARGFNPKTGHHEDAATGVAAAALAATLKKNIKVRQGDAINKPSLILVDYINPEEIYVGGKTITEVS